jgi:hypothetical protein
LADSLPRVGAYSLLRALAPLGLSEADRDPGGDMTRRIPGRVAIAATLVVLALGVWGCSGDDGGETSGVPRGELPSEGEAVVYEFYTES